MDIFLLESSLAKGYNALHSPQGGYSNMRSNYSREPNFMWNA